mgnify:CR=1 FL=1
MAKATLFTACGCSKVIDVQHDGVDVWAHTVQIVVPTSRSRISPMWTSCNSDFPTAGETQYKIRRFYLERESVEHGLEYHEHVPYEPPCQKCEKWEDTYGVDDVF